MLDFEATEFAQRLENAQREMRASNLDAIFLCTEPEIRYFSGFRTPFWLSPTRPWFLILPAIGEPIAVIPSIGESLMARSWVDNIYTWPSPNPDDEGVSLLVSLLNNYQRVGVPMGPETFLRLPHSDYLKITRELASEFVDCSPIIQRLRMVKSEREIQYIQSACTSASNAFSNASELFFCGQPLDEAFRAFKIELLRQGVDDVPYLVGAAGQGGYHDVISPPHSKPLMPGDVMMLDTGSQYKGYFCDFDRNFSIGKPDALVSDAYDRLWNATQSGLDCARAGTTCSQLFATISVAMHGRNAKKETSNVGRYGHGLGMQLTEWPSIAANDHTVLEPGMVMTLEPSLEYGAGKMMVHEENIVITRDAPILLSRRAPSQIQIF